MSLDPSCSVYRLLYRSRSALTGSDAAIQAEVNALLQQSAANNARDGVTGALMFTSSVFIQALEGARDQLETTFERICCDLRHLDVQLIEFSCVSERAFGEWSLHRVHAATSIEVLLAQMVHAPTDSAYAAQAAIEAVTLMSTLIRLEGAPEAERRARA